MSSLATALTRTQCALPIFIQLGSPSKRFYCGVWLNSSTQTTLDMILLKTVPPQCSTLKEIICFYKRSIPCAVSPFPQTFVSVRYTFCLQNFVGCVSLDSHLYPQLDDPWALPFGTLNDPVQDLLLATTWVSVSEHFVLEDLDPVKAPHQSLRYTALAGAYCSLHGIVEQVLAQWGNGTKPASSEMVREEAQVEPYLHFIFGATEGLCQETKIKSCPRGGCVTERIALALCLILNKTRSPIAFYELWRLVKCIYQRWYNVSSKHNQFTPALFSKHMYSVYCVLLYVIHYSKHMYTCIGVYWSDFTVVMLLDIPWMALEWGQTTDTPSFTRNWK